MVSLCIAKIVQPTENLSYSYFERQAHSILKSRVRRANSGLYEEFRDGDLERECHEEKCNKEEVFEIFHHNSQKSKIIMEQITNKCKYGENGKKCKLPGTKTCVNLWNEMECKCWPGYEGTYCENDRSACLEASKKGEVLCKGEHAKCIDKPGWNYMCKCEPGFEIDLELKACADIDECVKYPTICRMDICINTIGSYFCEVTTSTITTTTTSSKKPTTTTTITQTPTTTKTTKKSTTITVVFGYKQIISSKIDFLVDLISFLW